MNLSQLTFRAFSLGDIFRLVAFGLLLLCSGCKKEEIINVVLPGGDPTDPSIQPMVRATYPTTGSNGPFNVYNPADGSNLPHFIVVFNKLMNISTFTRQRSILKGFSGPAYAEIDRNSNVWDGLGDILSFVVLDSLRNHVKMNYRVGQRIEVIVDSTVEDINGNHLVSRFSFNFIPEPYFRVLSIHPGNKASDVSATIKQFEVRFNSPVDQAILPYLQIKPRPIGRWKLYTYDSLRFIYQVTDRTLIYDTDYTITVTAGAHDTQNRILSNDYSSTFRSISFKVSSTEPSPNATGVMLSPYIHINTTGPILSLTAESAFSILPSVDGKIYSGGAQVQYALNTTLKPITTYRVTMSSLLKASDGTALIPYEFTFTTDQFKVLNTDPEDGSINVPRNNPIRIYFNGAIDTGSIRSAFSITPGLEGTFPMYGWEYGIGYDHSGYASNTTYTVTISTAMRTKAGDNLLSPYTFSFTSAP